MRLPFMLCLICRAAAAMTEEAPTPAVTPAPAAEPGGEKSERTLLMPRNDIAGVKNFAKISDGLYRGEQPTASHSTFP